MLINKGEEALENLASILYSLDENNADEKDIQERLKSLFVNILKVKVYVEGKDIFTLKDEALTIFRRRKIGFVFQSFNLVPTLNVYENIVFPIQLDGNDVDDKSVNEVIGTLGLADMQNRLPNQLSGGQQRAAIARALATKPAIILADEPTGNLDSKTSQDVLSLLKVTGQKFSQTIVMITHLTRSL